MRRAGITFVVLLLVFGCAWLALIYQANQAKPR